MRLRLFASREGKVFLSFFFLPCLQIDVAFSYNFEHYRLLLETLFFHVCSTQPDTFFSLAYYIWLRELGRYAPYMSMACCIARAQLY